MNAPKHPKPDLPIHLRQAIQLASCVLRRIKEKQAQKETEAETRLPVVIQVMQECIRDGS